MNDENDFLMRQIKSFAEGLGYMLAKKKGTEPTMSRSSFPTPKLVLFPINKRSSKKSKQTILTLLTSFWNLGALIASVSASIYGWLVGCRSGALMENDSNQA